MCPFGHHPFLEPLGLRSSEKSQPTPPPPLRRSGSERLPGGRRSGAEAPRGSRWWGSPRTRRRLNARTRFRGSGGEGGFVTFLGVGTASFSSRILKDKTKGTHFLGLFFFLGGGWQGPLERTHPSVCMVLGIGRKLCKTQHAVRGNWIWFCFVLRHLLGFVSKGRQTQHVSYVTVCLQPVRFGEK